MPIAIDRLARAQRLTPYFDVQLQLARRLAAITGQSVGELALSHTNLHRRFGLGKPGRGQLHAVWQQFADRLDATPDPVAQADLAVATYATAEDEALPLAGQTAFGCFACEAPAPGTVGEHVVRIHFNNLDTDAEGGPLARSKQARRRVELTAMTRHIATTWPQATHIRGGSWLYHVEAYRRLFPSEYLRAATPYPAPTLTGSSTWGQLIDSSENIRADVRATVVSNLRHLDASAPWRAFPLHPLVPVATVDVFRAHFGV